MNPTPQASVPRWPGTVHVLISIVILPAVATRDLISHVIALLGADLRGGPSFESAASPLLR
ncbi:hypothetical protein ABT127_12345 [Streptomyces sp. NPDC001904]|uniref:hypothetical protein n=1 Tax=Streptomyces sp. NPDC001904 TaxID=3154531 RepID=UPI003327AAD4